MMGRGRPATGRTSKTVRVRLDMDMELAIALYYEWMPIIEEYRSSLKDSPRYDKLRRLLEELKPLPQAEVRKLT